MLRLIEELRGNVGSLHAHVTLQSALENSRQTCISRLWSRIVIIDILLSRSSRLHLYVYLSSHGDTKTGTSFCLLTNRRTVA